MGMLSTLHVIISVLLIASILLQNRGTGSSGIFGGSDNVFSVKRGAEKIIFNATIVLSALFLSLAIANLFFSQ